MKPYALLLFSSILSGQQYVAEFSAMAKGYRRTIRFDGGYWKATWTLHRPIQELLKWFHEYLGHHVEEWAGGEKTWEGLVYEMTLNDGKTSRTRSLDTMFNYVTATYIDSAGNVGTTTAASEAQSIARYERREELLSMDNFEQAEAEARRDLHLLRSAYPWSRPDSGVANVSLDEIGGPYLEVTACGYVFAANWRYVSTADGATGNISAWVDSIIGTDCPLLQKGKIESNTFQKKRLLEIPQRAWDTIQELLEVGDGAGGLWRAWVGNDRRLSYERVSTTPNYYIKGGQVFRGSGQGMALNLYKIKPGVYRDIEYPVRRQEYGSWYEQAGDFITEEISVGDRSGLTWSALDFSDVEQLAAVQEYEQMLEDEAASGGGERSRLNWKRVLGFKEGTAEWERAKKMSWAEKQKLIEEFKKRKRRRG